MEPSIQYAKTEDGVSIAYWTLGEGAPLVMTAGSPFSTSLRAWQTPEGRRFFELLTQNRWLIKYDHRGFGHSQHDVAEHSLDALVSDLEAVVDHLKLERFQLFAYNFSVPFAITFAARHPDRVTQLVLFSASSRGEDYYHMTRLRSAREAAEDDPEFFLNVLVHEAFGWSDSEHAREAVATMLEETDLDLLKSSVDSQVALNVTDLLPQVTAPTLVLHRRQLRRPPLDAARALTARIANARLVVVEGDSNVPYLGDAEPILRAVDEFLSEEEEAEPATAPVPGLAMGGFATILFTDMEASTTLADRLGDAAAQEVRRAHNDIVRSALSANSGSEIKHTGDGIMASFATASSGLDCAIAIQQGVAAHKDEQPDSPLAVYVGLNAGEPIAEDNDLFGTSINLAARICDHADAGQIVAANVVRELAAGKDFLFSDLGETELRGFEDPVKLWELRWHAEGSP